MPTFIAGDTAPFIVSLRRGDLPYVLDPLNDTVEAAFQINGALITDAVTQVSTTAGADWTNARVAIQFDQTNADLLKEFSGRGGGGDLRDSNYTSFNRKDDFPGRV